MSDDLVTLAIDADEAFTARVRMFTMHNLRPGPAVRVLEHPRDPHAVPDYGKPMPVDETMTFWDFGDEKLAKDFIKLQGWKAAVSRVLQGR